MSDKINVFKKIRTKKKLSQSKFAGLMGCSQSTLSKIESEKLIPSVRSLARLFNLNIISKNDIISILFDYL